MFCLHQDEVQGLQCSRKKSNHEIGIDVIVGLTYLVISSDNIDYGLVYNHVRAVKIDKMIQKCKRFSIEDTVDIGRLSPLFAATSIKAQCCLA